MANYNDVLGALREYRNELEQSTTEEVEAQFTTGGTVMSSFAARGGVSAFSTPLANVHATGVGVRYQKGKMVKDDYVIKVYVFDKFDLGSNTPELTKGFQGIDVDVEPLPIQLALATAAKKAAAKNDIANHRARHRPFVGGVSIAPLNESFVGTLGCFLQRTSNGARQIFTLSNNHVLADTNRLPIGIGNRAARS